VGSGGLILWKMREVKMEEKGDCVIGGSVISIFKFGKGMICCMKTRALH
jgi:hypothetical protein